MLGEKFFFKRNQRMLEELILLNSEIRWTEPRLLRFLYALDFKKPEALKAIKEYTLWRNKALPPSLTPASEKILVTIYL